MRTPLNAIFNVRFLVFGAAITVMLLIILHLGPHLGVNERQRVIASCRLADGSSLFLIQRRNKELTEAYTVSFFRVFPTNWVEWCELGDEESYWWSPSFRTLSSGASVEIRMNGAAACIYNTQTHQVKFIDSRRPEGRPQGARDHPLVPELERIARAH
jgi:hypothetical protein